MVSARTLEQLDRLHTAQNRYKPNETIATALGHVSLLMFVGATCEGKNTVMAEVAQLDKRFAIGGVFTSREPRNSDNPNLYAYIPHTDEGLQPVFSQIAARQVVQYAVNPHTKHIYGSNLTDYHGRYTMSDIFSTTVAGLEQLGFGQTRAFTIVREPGQWVAHFNERFPVGHPQRHARRDEAIESFGWSLETAGTHVVVENTEDAPFAAARAIVGFVTGGVVPDETRAQTFLQESLILAKDITI